MSALEEIEELERAIARNAGLTALIAQNQRFSNAPSRISQIYAKLTSEQRTLFRSLVERYEIHTSFESHAYEAAKKIAVLIQLGAKVTITTPYIAQPNQPKSGQALAYEIKSILNGEGFASGRFDTFNITPSHIEPSTIYFMVDDFSGSGRTVCSGIMDMLMKGARSDQIHVDLFYAMKQAEAAIRRCGVSITCGEVGSKAVSDFDYPSFGFGGDANATYLAIENMIKVPKGYSLGYESSESLITLKRTPNNTLPIFWAQQAAGGAPWPAPFPR